MGGASAGALLSLVTFLCVPVRLAGPSGPAAGRQGRRAQMYCNNRGGREPAEQVGAGTRPPTTPQPAAAGGATHHLVIALVDLGQLALGEVLRRRGGGGQGMGACAQEASSATSRPEESLPPCRLFQAQQLPGACNPAALYPHLRRLAEPHHALPLNQRLPHAPRLLAAIVVLQAGGGAAGGEGGQGGGSKAGGGGGARW